MRCLPAAVAVSVSILLGRGKQEVRGGRSILHPGRRSRWRVKIVNGDGHPDLAVALRNDKSEDFLGNGRGEFRQGCQYEYGDTPTSLDCLDLNQDGKPGSGSDKPGADAEPRSSLDGQQRQDVSGPERL